MFVVYGVPKITSLTFKNILFVVDLLVSCFYFTSEYRGTERRDAIWYSVFEYLMIQDAAHNITIPSVHFSLISDFFLQSLMSYCSRPHGWYGKALERDDFP